MSHAVMLVTDSLVLQVFNGERKKAHLVARSILSLVDSFVSSSSFLNITCDGNVHVVSGEDFENASLDLPDNSCFEKAIPSDVPKAESVFIKASNIKGVYIINEKASSKYNIEEEEESDEDIRGGWWMR